MNMPTLPLQLFAVMLFTLGVASCGGTNEPPQSEVDADTTPTCEESCPGECVGEYCFRPEQTLQALCTPILWVNSTNFGCEIPFQDGSQLRSFDKECNTDEECADSPYGPLCTMRLCSRFTTCESDADCEADQGCNLEFGACALLPPVDE